MEDWILVILSAVIGLAGGFVLLVVRDILLYNEKLREKRKRYLIENRLEKLYSPLYMRIKASEIIFGKRGLIYGKSSGEKGEGKEREEIKKVIHDGIYLASEELQPLLAELYFKPVVGSEKTGKITELIVKEYEELRKQYFKI